MNPYYTHQEYLIKILDSLDYTKNIKCLEFGSGDGSSSIFNKYVKKNNMSVRCFEHDTEWLNTMIEKYRIPNYEFNEVKWEDFNYNSIKNEIYDLVFVDQGDWDARITTIDELKKVSKYIILHDYCYYNGFRGSSIPDVDKECALNVNEDSFFYKKYNEDFELISEHTLFPPTLIMKNKNI